MRAAAGIFLASVMLTATLLAQRPTDVVRWSASAPKGAAAAGGLVAIEVIADVQPGWHLYALSQPKGGPNPLAFATAKGSPYVVRTKDIKGPPPELTKDENFNLQTRQHAGRVVFTVPVEIPRAAAAGAQTIPLQVTFQACGNGLCLRPFTHPIDVDIVITK